MRNPLTDYTFFVTHTVTPYKSTQGLCKLNVLVSNRKRGCQPHNYLAQRQLYHLVSVGSFHVRFDLSIDEGISYAAHVNCT